MRAVLLGVSFGIADAYDVLVAADGKPSYIWQQAAAVKTCLDQLLSTLLMRGSAFRNIECWGGDGGRTFGHDGFWLAN